MNLVQVMSTVGSDGVLRLEVPLHKDEAGHEVRVTVARVPTKMTQEEWRAFIERTAGTWQGDFERPPQGEYEQRNPLP
jgi:hypothetical protein